MTKDIIIREAKFEDIKYMTEINVRTWQYAFKGLIDQDYLDNLNIEERTKKWEELYLKRSPKTRYLVAEQDNKIVGFCNVGPDSDDNTGRVYSIYMDTQFMDKGIGTELLIKGLENLRGIGFKDAVVWTLANSSRSRNFYEKNGWISDGKMETITRDKISYDVIRYKKSLRS